MSTSTQISGVLGKRETDDHAEHDHMSNLPDCVMSLILSRLSTKEAVRTSVLSKVWEYKWTSIHNIELDDHTASGKESKRTNFINFVERTLLLPKNSQSLRLSCSKLYDFSTMQSWINAAFSRDIHCVYIRYRAACIDLPHDLLNLYTLRKLELDVSPCTFKVPPEICFPHLETLRLARVDIFNESNSDLVKFNFPVLETFLLSNCKWLNVKFVEIHAPKMTRFMFASTWDAGVADYSIRTIGDNLEKFESFGGLPENIVLSCGSEVVYADLAYKRGSDDVQLLEKRGLQIRKLLTGLSSLKDLELSGFAVEAIALSRRGGSLLKYYKMKRLTLIYIHGNTEDLLELLHSMPFLKTLDLNVERWKDHNDDADKNVPSCIVSHLEIVKFTCFFDEGWHEMLKLAKFFLKNAIQLKQLQLCFSQCTVRFCNWDYPFPPPFVIDAIKEELWTYPRASTTLKVVVT